MPGHITQAASAARSKITSQCGPQPVPKHGHTTQRSHPTQCGHTTQCGHPTLCGHTTQCDPQAVLSWPTGWRVAAGLGGEQSHLPSCMLDPIVWNSAWLGQAKGD
eukprot:364747-Chlamydomonas_euryale.AAC.18